jgi:hypothetical protein
MAAYDDYSSRYRDPNPANFHPKENHKVCTDIHYILNCKKKRMNISINLNGYHLPSLTCEELIFSKTQYGLWLPNMPNLIKLNLEEQLYHSPNFVFPDMPKLECLILARNKLSSNFILPKLPLQKLCLAGNRLGANWIFHNCPNLVFLNLSTNNLGPLWKLPNLPLLDRLIISCNDLQTDWLLNNQQNMPAIRSLDITFNNIKSLDFNNLHLPDLRIIYVRGDYTMQLSKIPFNIEYCDRDILQSKINKRVNDFFPSIIKLLKLTEPSWSNSEFDMLPNELMCHIIGLCVDPMLIAHVCRMFYWCTWTTTTALLRTNHTDRRALLHVHLQLHGKSTRSVLEI